MASMAFDIFARDHASKTFDDVGDSAKRLERRLDGVGKSGDTLKGRFSGLSGAASSLSGPLSGLAGHMTGVASSTLSMGATLLTSALKLGTFAAAAASAASGAVGLVAALAPAAGALAALPGIAAVGIAAMGVLKLAFISVGDAMKAAFAGDEKAFEKALERLTPAARDFAKEFKAAVPAMKEFQQAAQTGFFSELNGSLAHFLDLLRGTQPWIEGLAKNMGSVAREALNFATSDKSIGSFNTILGNTSGLVTGLRVAMQPVLRGFLDLAVVGSNWLNGLSVGISDSAVKFGQWLSKISESGQAMQWLDNALLVFKQLGAIAKDFGGILRAVFHAMKTAGSDALGVIGQLADKLNTFLNSAEGQRVLVEVFKALQEAAAAFFPVIKAVAGAVGDLAPKIADLAVAVGPVLTAAVNALGPALAALAPGLIAAIGGIQAGVEALGPALLPLGQAIGAAFATLQPVFAALGQGIAALLPGVETFVTAFAGGLAALAPVLGPLGAAIGGIFAELGTALALIIPQLGKIALALAPALAGALRALGPALAALGPGLIAVAEYLARAFASPEMQRGLLALGKGIADVLIAAAPLLPIIAQLAGILAQVLGGALTNLGTLLKPIIEALGRALEPALRAISDALNILIPLMAPVYKAFGDIAAALITQLLPPLLDLIPVMINSIIPAFAEMAREIQPLIPLLADLAVKFIRDTLPALLPMVPQLTEMSLAFARMGIVLGELVAEAAPHIERIIGMFQHLYDSLVGHSIIPDLINGMTKWFRDGVQWIKDIVSWFGELPSMIAAWLGQVVTWVQTKWDEIKNGIAAKIDEIHGKIGDVLGAISDKWHDIWGGIKDFVGGKVAEIKNAISSKFDEVVAFFRDIPNRIVGALGNLGNLLYESGRSLIQGLINGLYSMLQNAYNAASDILGQIRNLFPFSPAKEGPFSGRGWTLFSGQSMAEGLAKGLAGGEGLVSKAAAGLMGAASMSLSPSVAVGGQAPMPLAARGGGDLHIHLAGSALMSRDELYRLLISALNEAKGRGFNLGGLGA